MVVAMALMSGYREDLERKLLGGNAAIVAYPLTPAAEAAAPELAARVATLDGVAEVVRTAYAEGSLAGDAAPDGVDVTVRGVDPGTSLAALGRIDQRAMGEVTRLAGGPLPGVILGSELAARLGPGEGEPLRLMVLGFRDGRPRFAYRSVRVVATFTSGFSEFDRRLALVDREMLVEMTGAGAGSGLLEVRLGETGGTSAGLEVRLGETGGTSTGSTSTGTSTAGSEAGGTSTGLVETGGTSSGTSSGTSLGGAAVVERVREVLGDDFLVRDWRELNSELFTALALQQVALFFVLGLIVLVSTFNVASSLVVLVRERMREIGVLAALGLEPVRLRAVFLLFGGVLSFAGTTIGLALGAGVSWLLTRYELIRFDAEVAEIYFLSSVPFRVRPLDLAAIVAFTLAVTLAACWLPARRAATVRPATALRYE